MNDTTLSRCMIYQMSEVLVTAYSMGAEETID